MIVKEYKIRDTGNSVADYTEVVETCSVCQGNGYLTPDRDQLIDIFRNNCYHTEEALGAYHHWKKTGELICPECGGDKTITRKY